MSRCLATVGLFLLLTFAWAGDPAPPPAQPAGADDAYIEVYRVFQQADTAAAAGQTAVARDKYLEATKQLEALQVKYPGWNETVVRYRLRYIAEQLEVLGRDPAVPGPGADLPPVPAPAAPSELQQARTEVDRLQREREVLQAQLKEALAARPAAADPAELERVETQLAELKKENATLKSDLARAKSPKPGSPEADELAKASARLAALQLTLSEREQALARLNLEKEALQSRVRANPDQADLEAARRENESLKRQIAAAQAAPPAPATDLDQVKRLIVQLRGEVEDERERAAALAAEKQVLEQRLAARPVPAAPATVATSARPTQPTPTPAPPTAPPTAAPPVAPPKETSAQWLAEATRDLEAKRYAAAEDGFRKIIRADARNTTALVGLARAQLAQDRPADAEATVRAALALEPQNKEAIALLGSTQLRQRKFEDAFVSLSKAAQSDPSNAGTFRLLGVVLREKGLDAPAENALRRSITLLPDNPDAHFELAQLYLAGKPPRPELARLHYQQSLDTGHAKDPGIEARLGTSTPDSR